MSGSKESVCRGASAHGYTCRDSIHLLRDYLDGEMPADMAAQLKEHLALCPPCVEFVQGYQQTPDLCRKALETRMPEALSARLSSFLHEKLKPQK